MHRARVVLVATLAIPLMAGCGTGDADPKSAAPSKREFVQTANRICKRADARLERLSKPRTPGQALRYLRKFRSIYEETIGELRRAEKPEGRAGKGAQEWLDTLSDEYVRLAGPELRRAEHAVRYQDRGEYRAVQRSLNRLKKRNKSDRLARKFGARSCGT